MKIAGLNEEKTLKAVKQELGVELADLKQLRKGQFFVQSGSYKPLTLRVPTFLLKDRNTMTINQWKKLVKSNLSKYYSSTDKISKENAQLKDKIIQSQILA